MPGRTMSRWVSGSSMMAAPLAAWRVSPSRPPLLSTASSSSRNCSRVKSRSPSSAVAKCVYTPVSRMNGSQRTMPISPGACSNGTPPRAIPVSTITWASAWQPTRRPASATACTSSTSTSVSTTFSMIRRSSAWRSSGPDAHPHAGRNMMIGLRQPSWRSTIASSGVATPKQSVSSSRSSSVVARPCP